MAFAFPSAENAFTVAPASNGNYVATVGAPTSAGVKTAGGLPITSDVGDWERDDAINGLQGYIYSFGTAQDVSTDTVLLLWHNQSNAPNRIQKDSVANDGNVIRIYTGSGSPSTNYRHFRVGGNDTPMCSNISGQYPVVIDLNDSSHETSSGTFDNTNVTQFAWICEPATMAGTNTMWNYPGQCYLLNTTKGGTNTPTFTGTSDWDDAVDEVAGTDYTDKIGQWVRQIGTVYFIDMPWQIGNNSTETDFNDNGVTVISPVADDSGDPRNRLTTQAMRTYLNLRNNAADTAIFSGTYIWGTRADFDWDQDDSAVVTFNSPTFTGMGTFTLGSSITGSATWNDVDPVVFADTGVDVDGSTFRSPNGSHALEMTAGAMDIADMRFESYASKHAILIDTAGTYNFDNVFFDQSGTNDIETTHATGTVTINVSNGGTVPTVTETGAGTVVVNNNITIRITATDADTGSPIEDAYVLMRATETVGTITNGDTLLEGQTNSSGVVETTTFNYEAAFDPSGLDYDLRVIKGDFSPAYVRVDQSGTITSSGVTLGIPMAPDD